MKPSNLYAILEANNKNPHYIQLSMVAYTCNPHTLEGKVEVSLSPTWASEWDFVSIQKSFLPLHYSWIQALHFCRLFTALHYWSWTQCFYSWPNIKVCQQRALEEH